MAFMSLMELFDLIVMIAAIGFIFSGIIRRPIPGNYDPLKHFSKNEQWENFKIAVIVAAPAIVLHELAHKVAAVSFGAPATFHAAYTWLAIGVALRMFSPGYIFFIPGYVSYAATLPPLAQALVSFAGPGMNFLLFLVAWFAIGQGWFKNHTAVLHMTKQINLFLFIFNMLPIPPFDGASVFTNLFHAFF
jgi:Zn-dependent protease